MKWSNYNFLFKSKKYGPLLYNSFTNTFAEFDEKGYNELLKIKSSPDNYNFKNNPSLFLQLINAKIIIEKNDDLVAELKLQSTISRFSSNILGLTIAPTFDCNFACSYCYEESRPPIYMNDKTESKIIDFIKKFGNIPFVDISWYGGEPLMAFDRIISISNRLKEENVRFTASMITNGYLLTKEKVNMLKELKIRFIQITLDGPEKIHNKRRPHITNNDSYQTITKNLEYLMDNWDGKCSIRVNIDNDNKNYYHILQKQLTEKYKGKNIHVYPGIVTDLHGCSSINSCVLNRNTITNFMIDQYEKYDIKALEFYPKNFSKGCSATNLNSYVIGANGELYKCWNDIGVKKMQVGSVYDNEPWNNQLLAKYLSGVEPFDDPKCRECFFLPICNGGCPNIAYLNKYKGGQHDNCIKFKGNLEKFLEIHYEIKMNEKKNKESL